MEYCQAQRLDTSQLVTQSIAASIDLDLAISYESNKFQSVGARNAFTSELVHLVTAKAESIAITRTSLGASTQYTRCTELSDQQQPGSQPKQSTSYDE